MPMYFEKNDPDLVNPTTAVVTNPVPQKLNLSTPSVGGGPPPALGSAPTADQFQQWILSSPEYKQGTQWLESAAKTGIQRINETAALQAQYQYGQTGGNSTYTPITIPQAFYDQMQAEKDKAAHENALRMKALPEIMAGRGMLSSGQTAFEQGELAYNYDTLLKDIALQKSAREQDTAEANRRGAASVAESNANRAAAAAQDSANRAVSQQLSANQDAYRIADINTGLAQDRNKLLGDVSSYYQNLWWDGSKYVGPTFASAGTA